MEPVFLLPLPAPAHIPLVGAGLKAVGVRLVEIGAWGGNFDYLNRNNIVAARKMLEAAGVQAYSYHPPFGGRYDVSAPGMAAWAHALELNRRHIAAAAALGARYYVLHPSDRLAHGDVAMRIHSLRRALRELARDAEAADIYIAVENLPPGYLGADIAELMWLVEGAGSRRVGVCFDTGHAHVVGWPMGRAIEAIGERLFTIHWHDNDGSRDQHLLPGQGTIDWADFFNALGRLGWDRPVCLECRWHPEWPPEEFVGRTRQALAARRAIVQ